MQIMRISALAPPESQRSQWARRLLGKALENGCTPSPVPPHKLQSFTATLPPGYISQLQALSESSRQPISQITAGLIEAALGLESEKQASEKSPDTPIPSMAGADRVRPLLHGLLQSSAEKALQGKVVFAEAATGTGKGRLIASLAANAAQSGDTVVVSAPLTVTWQLLDDLASIEEAKTVGVSLVLGRANFVAPSLAYEWAKGSNCQQMIDWIDGGGQPLSKRAVNASTLVGRPLCWLLEDALAVSEDLPVSMVSLDSQTPGEGDSDICPAEALYQELRSSHNDSAIILCSHFMLASHLRSMQLLKLNAQSETDITLSLPLAIDLLIVDEAHLLESAFATINSHSLHIRTLTRIVDKYAGRNKRPLKEALESLGDYISGVKQSGKKRPGLLSDFEGANTKLEEVNQAFSTFQFKKMDSHAATALRIAHRAIISALSGRSLLRFDVSPVLRYPQLTVGQANLEKHFLSLWDCVVGAVLVSATIYSDGKSAKLSRWKLAVPVERAEYLPPVHPSWTFSPVRAQRLRAHPSPEGNTEQWLDSCASSVLEVTEKAQGGTLVLCTSYLNAEHLSARLQERIGPRLIVQNQTTNATMCMVRYRAMHEAGSNPVWVGLGSAWTGIDLTDHAKAPEDDTLLTDLVITRLPLGVNRTLTHERRVSITGYGVVVQEAVWHFRQGLGRLVRREGIKDRNLWVLDERIDSNEPWLQSFKAVMARYPTM